MKRCFLYVRYFIGAFLLLSTAVTITSCNKVHASGSAGPLELGTAFAIAPDARVVIEADHPSTGVLLVTMSLFATGKTPADQLLPHILVTYDAVPGKSDAQMDMQSGAFIIRQTLTGSTEKIHSITVTDDRSGDTASWKVS